MLKIRAVIGRRMNQPPDRAPDESYCRAPETMCEDCYTECNSDTRTSCITGCIPCDVDVEPFLDTICAEESITSAEEYAALLKKWQERKVATTSSFLVLHCNLLGPEAQILRQKLGLKRNTSIHIVYSDVREDGDALPGSGVNLEISRFKDMWRMEMREKAKTVKDPTAVFRGNGGMRSLEEITLEDLLVMYVPSIFAEFYAHSLSALMNSLHTFTPFLDDGRRRGGKVKAPAPACCLENAVTHSQRKRTSARDQALYDSANLVATQLYLGVGSHFGSRICHELERRGAGIASHLRIGLEDETVPFHNLYVARGGAVPLRRAHDESSGSRFEIVCWTCYGSPDGGEFVIPSLMYKFHTGQGSTVLFRPNRFYHATLPPENRDSVNEKFAVALIS